MRIISLINKNSISFFADNDNTISFLKKIPLFFYFDKTDNSFRNSDIYKIFALENNSNTFSDIFTFFLENKSINNPIAKDYSFFIKKIFSEIIEMKPNYEKIEIVFSEIFSSSEKEKIFNFLSANYKIHEQYFSISELSAKNYVLKKQISSIQNILVVQNDENDLIYTNYSFNTEKIDKILSGKLKNTIYLPNAFAISNNLLNDIIRIYSLKIADKQKNLNYIYYKILDKADEIENLPKNFAVISTKILGSKDRFSVRIDTNRIKLLKQVYLKNLITSLKEKISISENFRLIVLGNLFDNKDLKDTFNENFDHFELQTFEEILETRNDNFTTSEDEFSTMFLEANPENDEESESKNISELEIQKLEIGEQIKLTNYDSRPNKGYSTQLIEYLGNNKFVVVESTRSLRTGDILETKNALWTLKSKLIFTVNRNGKIYGRFQTREIQSIEIILKKS